MTGRPRNQKYDEISKECEVCGARFYLRDKKFQSFNRFARRRFCSVECSVSLSPRIGRLDHKAWIRERVTTTDSGCWEWKQRRHVKGYGLAHIGRRCVRAHRYAYEVWCGPIPEGMMVLHSCDNPPCCNPDHLRVGTAKDNAQDAILRGRAPQFKRKAA